MKEPELDIDFFTVEQKILGFWKTQNILNRSIEQRDSTNLRVFYDGPITANGEPHHGHMLTFAMKDIIPRYWTMQGYRVPRSLGWDCQGIPVEYEVEKKLGFREKKDIEKYGIGKFNQLCRRSVQMYMDDIVELENLMGRLTQKEGEYQTMDKNYIESIWWSLSELYKKDLLYEGFKVVPYSTRAGTTLSNAEVSLGGYKNVVDPSIVVSFQLKGKKDEYLLAWTTTPWTVPGNLVLAIGQRIPYVKVLHKNGNKYILAKSRVEDVIGDDLVRVVANVSSAELIGIDYIPPFDLFDDKDATYKVVIGDHVTSDSGTGVVHIAPYGVEDNEILIREGIQSFDYLDEGGCFTNEVPEYEGLDYRAANSKIIEYLKDSKVLFSYTKLPHEVAVCWRTKTPLIYRPITSWYIRTESKKKELVKNNQGTTWVPEHAKEGRFGNWLENIKDWGISRSRYWGTPLPIWKSDSGKVKVIGSYSELEQLCGESLSDPHRPYVDEVTFEIDGEEYKRIPDVLDVWYDSGSMPFASLHYPFENKELFEQKFPADYISESVDQTRGWFYSLHAISTLLFDSSAFTGVVMSGYVLDDEGMKLSKSKGNYTSPVPMIQKHSADAIRLNFFSTPITSGEDTTISGKTLKQQRQETIIPLWNIYRFLAIYSVKKGWKPKLESLLPGYLPKSRNKLDVWLVVRLHQTIEEVTESMNAFEITRGTKALKVLVKELSKWYIRRSRDRFNDEDDIDSIEVLYYVLMQTIKLMAPFIPFLTDYIYQSMVGDLDGEVLESIHLCDFPEVNKKFLEENRVIVDQMELVRKICAYGHSARAELGVMLKTPLGGIQLKLDSDEADLPEWTHQMIAKELNVEDIEIVDSLQKGAGLMLFPRDNSTLIGLKPEITKTLENKGKVRAFIRSIQVERKRLALPYGSRVNISVGKGLINKEILEENRYEILRATSANMIEIVLDLLPSEVQLKVSLA